MKLFTLFFGLALTAFGKEDQPCLEGLWVYKNYAGTITEATRIFEDNAEVYVCYLSAEGYIVEKSYQGLKPRPHIIRITDDYTTHYIHSDADDTISQTHEFDFGAYADVLTRATNSEAYLIYLKGCLFEQYSRRYELWDEL